MGAPPDPRLKQEEARGSTIVETARVFTALVKRAVRTIASVEFIPRGVGIFAFLMRWWMEELRGRFTAIKI